MTDLLCFLFKCILLARTVTQIYRAFTEQILAKVGKRNQGNLIQTEKRYISKQSNIEPNPKHFYSELIPIIVNGSYSLVTQTELQPESHKLLHWHIRL